MFACKLVLYIVYYDLDISIRTMLFEHFLCEFYFFGVQVRKGILVKCT